MMMFYFGGLICFIRKKREGPLCGRSVGYVQQGVIQMQTGKKKLFFTQYICLVIFRQNLKKKRLFCL